MTLYNYLLVSVAITALCGCTSMATRIKQQNYSKWPSNIQQAVDGGAIIPGMNKLQVLAATNVPETLIKKRTQLLNDGTYETWILYKSMGGYYFSDPGFSSTVIISFKDGVVNSVSF